MIIVTGAAGFIGSCILAEFNRLGRTDLYIVDHMDGDDKKKNIAGRKFTKYFDKAEFLDLIKADKIKDKVECLVHMGACSSTTGFNHRYYDENNFEYTRVLAEWALQHQGRFIYASSAATYGDGSAGYKDDEKTIRRCRPLNLYGQSKQKFDLWVLDQGHINQMVGLRFFNVFGPNEYHKGDMRSVMAKAYDRVVGEGKISLFKSYRRDYADGEQKRDFIYVKDAVDVVMFFWKNPNVNGIFNLGTGKARTWNDVARSLFKAAGKPLDIKYIDMPEDLRPQYQYFTEADMTQLRSKGYTKPFRNLEEAVADYAKYLKDHRYL